MKRLIDAIIAKWFCLHDWKIHFTTTIHWSPEDGGGVKGVRETLVCKKCGKFRKQNL